MIILLEKHSGLCAQTYKLTSSQSYIKSISLQVHTAIYIETTFYYRVDVTMEQVTEKHHVE